jgi:hypothetical protein
MNSLLMAANFQFKPIGKYIPDCGESKAGCGVAPEWKGSTRCPQQAVREISAR